MEEESIAYSNDVTADTFSHPSSAQRENANAVFTSDKLGKLDYLVDAVKNLTINDAKYYQSKTATESDAQVNLTSDPETVTHTSNGIFEQKILCCRTIPVLTPPMNPGLLAIRLTPSTLLTPVMK